MSTPSLFDLPDEETKPSEGATRAMPPDETRKSEGMVPSDEPDSSERIFAAQLALLRRYLTDDAVSESDIRAGLQTRFGAASLDNLTKWQGSLLLQEMQQREKFQEREKAKRPSPDKSKH